MEVAVVCKHVISLEESSDHDTQGKVIHVQSGLFIGCMVFNKTPCFLEWSTYHGNSVKTIQKLRIERPGCMGIV